mmetsp:Transcript_38183/g.106376  ORF Transcript_38183/g.106376 Transcript_38183/m.106376 type:complete len:303 (+) Transcript_38183:384-1292(+)
MRVDAIAAEHAVSGGPELADSGLYPAAYHQLDSAQLLLTMRVGAGPAEHALVVLELAAQLPLLLQSHIRSSVLYLGLLRQRVGACCSLHPRQVGRGWVQLLERVRVRALLITPTPHGGVVLAEPQRPVAVLEARRLREEEPALGQALGLVCPQLVVELALLHELGLPGRGHGGVHGHLLLRCHLLQGRLLQRSSFLRSSSLAFGSSSGGCRLLCSQGHFLLVVLLHRVHDSLPARRAHLCEHGLLLLAWLRWQDDLAHAGAHRALVHAEHGGRHARCHGWCRRHRGRFRPIREGRRQVRRGG